MSGRRVGPTTTAPETEAAEPAADDREPERTGRQLRKDRKHQEEARHRDGQSRHRPVEAVERHEPDIADPEWPGFIPTAADGDP